MNIIDFLEKLCKYTYIDFPGNESEISLLAKNKSSIFVNGESNKPENDLSIFITPEKESDKMYNEDSCSFSSTGILLPVPEKVINQIKEMATRNGREDFTELDILVLGQLSAEELEYAEEFFYIAERGDKQLSVKSITALAKNLPKDKFEYAKQFFYIKERGEQQLSGHAIAELANLPDDKIERAKSLLYIEEFGDKQINGDYIVDNLLNLSENEYKKLVEQGYCCKFKIEEEGTIFDERLNVKQIITNGRLTQYSLSCKKILSKHAVVLSETLIYYDEQSNVIKTINLKMNPENGALNVSETDSKGNQRPIQWESIDPDTGATITERHLTSPEGVKTDYYAEENDNLKITDYKITDKDGNTLINVYQTFEKIDENKYISSINATGNPEDTQIYEMEYTNDNILKILDKKNNKTTEISLNELFEDNESAEKLLPIIKQLPGHVLAHSKNLYSFKYDNKYAIENAVAGNTIKIGNYEETLGEQENLLSVIAHEVGHMTLSYPRSEDFHNTVAQEYEELIKTTTSAQQKYITYFTTSRNNNWEKTAETHAILNSINQPNDNMRRFYLAQYFPRTMAAIMKLLLEEEGVKV